MIQVTASSREPRTKECPLGRHPSEPALTPPTPQLGRVPACEQLVQVPHPPPPVHGFVHIYASTWHLCVLPSPATEQAGRQRSTGCKRHLQAQSLLWPGVSGTPPRAWFSGDQEKLFTSRRGHCYYSKHSGYSSRGSTWSELEPRLCSASVRSPNFH